MNEKAYIEISEFNELIGLYKDREAFEDYTVHYEEITKLIKNKIMSIRENVTALPMTLDNYQELSKRTMPPDRSYVGLLWILNNYGLGLTGEAGEVADLIKKKVHHGHGSITTDDFKKELGDVLHYLSGIATILNISLSDVGSSNIQKLLDRYPNGFNTNDSIARKDLKL